MNLNLLLTENSLVKVIGEIFHPLFEFFGLILAGLYAIWPNYGFAIAVLTILIMLALTPITVKSTKSMIAMQRLQPEMKKLQAKYKGPENREALNQEMMKLYKENGTSPFGACLPSLLQMPFLIVLYTLIRGLSNTVSKGHQYTNQFGHYVTCMKTACGAPRYIPTHSQMHTDLVNSVGQMHWWFGMDLSSLPFSNHTTDPFTHAVTSSASQAVLVLPYLVLIGAAMFLQYYQMRQMNSRNPQAAAANPQMQTMQKFFPFIFGLIYLRIPAGATIYMVVSSAMRIATQEVMFKTGMVTPVSATEREIGPNKSKTDAGKPKEEGVSKPKEEGAGKPKKEEKAITPPPKPKKRSATTDGTALAKGTVPPKPRSRGNGAGRTGRPRAANGKKAAGPEQNSSPKPQNRSRSKRSRKSR